MEYLSFIVIFCYVIGTIAYVAYFFARKRPTRNSGYYMLLVGFLLHSIMIGYSGWTAGAFPARNLHETLVFAAWSVAGVFLLLRYKFDLKVLGVYTAPLTAVIMMIATGVPDRPVEASPFFKSVWLAIHVTTIFIGEAAFALACGVGVLYLAQEHAIKAKNHGFFFKRLPSLELIDSTAYGCLVVGFTFLTLGLISGFVYAKSVWGHFWNWDTKEVWSVISWLVYAALLHQRLTVGWRGRRAAIMAIIGFSALLFTFLGVNFWLKGHHGEFTRF